MISGDLLTQEESPDWREAKWEVNERKTSIGHVAKITLQLKLSLSQQEREQCLYSLENIWGAGTGCVQNLWGTSVSWGETTALHQNQIHIFNYLFAEPAQQLPQPCVQRGIKARTRI